MAKCVYSPRRVPGSRQVVAQAAPHLGHAGGRWATRAGRGVAQGDEHEDADEHAGRRGAEERRRPRRAVQQGDQRIGGDDRAQLADDAGELRDQRNGPAGEPHRDHPQDADEGHGVAGADEHAGRDAVGTSVAIARTSCPAAMVRAPARTIGARSEAIERQPDGHLKAGVDGQLQHEEQRHRRRPGGEPLLRLHRGDAERRPVEHRDRVGEQAHAPHEVGPCGGTDGRRTLDVGSARSPQERQPGSPRASAQSR